MASTSPMTLYDPYILRIPIYISTFHLSFKSTHPAAETPLLGCVISSLVCSHLNFQWSCKALTFPVFTVLKGALADNPEIMFNSLLSSYPHFLIPLLSALLSKQITNLTSYPSFPIIPHPVGLWTALLLLFTCLENLLHTSDMVICYKL